MKVRVEDYTPNHLEDPRTILYKVYALIAG